MSSYLCEARRNIGYTQEYMAKELKVAVSTYSQYESGVRNIPGEKATMISKILNIELSKIFLPAKFTVSKHSAN